MDPDNPDMLDDVAYSWERGGEDQLSWGGDATLPPPQAPVCSSCGRERTMHDAYDYSPLQVITGQPVGWYSGDDGEFCPECMTKVLRGEWS